MRETRPLKLPVNKRERVILTRLRDKLGLSSRRNVTRAALFHFANFQQIDGLHHDDFRLRQDPGDED